MPDSCQENNADVNLCNLDVKQNHSRTVNCLQTFSMSSHLTTPAAPPPHIKSTVPSFYKSKRKQITLLESLKKKSAKHPHEPTKHSWASLGLKATLNAVLRAAHRPIVSGNIKLKVFLALTLQVWAVWVIYELVSYSQPKSYLKWWETTHR